MTLLDRLLIRNFLKAYFVCLISFLGLYIIVDLFTNLEDFAQENQSLLHVLKHITFYYGFKVTQIFDRLCEMIVLIAAAFTVAWVQRCNELVPLLSAGVSTRRVFRPVLLGALILTGLGIANQELIIPHIAMDLTNDRSDPEGTKDIVVQGAYEPTSGVHIEGDIAHRTGMVIDNLYIVVPEKLAGSLMNFTALKATYIPLEAGKPRSGGWHLTGVKPPTLPKDWNQPNILEPISEGVFFLHTEEVDFETLTRSRTWYTMAATPRVFQELSKPDSTRLAPMAVLFHTRLTRPLVAMILVLAGISVILRDQNRNIFLSTGFCLILCGMFFAAQFTCKSLGDNEYISPALAAWIPVLIFGPLSVSMFDAVHT